MTVIPEGARPHKLGDPNNPPHVYAPGDLAVPGSATSSTDYPYVDMTVEMNDPVVKKTEASHAEVNPAFYPKSAKPESLWGEAEQEGAEGPPSFSYAIGWK